MSRHRTVVAILLWLAAWGVLAALPLRARGPELDRSVRKILARSSERPEELVEALVQLGPGAMQALFSRLIAEGEKALAPERRELVACALVARGPGELAGFLQEATAQSDQRIRLVAVELLGRCSTTEQFSILLLLASDAASSEPDALALTLRNSLANTLVRDPRAFRELIGAWNKSRGRRADLLAAVGESQSPAGLEFLAWVAERPEGLDRAVATEFLALATRIDPLRQREDLERMVTLLESEDTACLQTASSALARLGVEAAIPAWIELLDHESRGVRERALASLVEMTDLSLGTSSERWQTWYDSELDWFHERAELAYADLDAEDHGSVLTALREIAQRRLYRDDLAREVLDLLDHPDPSIRLYACRVLEGLGSRVALDSLVRRLEDDDQTVARAAWKALRRCSGLDLPFEPEAWRAGLAQP